MGSTKAYVVEVGDCLSSIGRQHNLSWKTVWLHPDNAELRRIRKNPNVLKPGDVVFVPDLEPAPFFVQTGAVYQFRVSVSSAFLRVQLVACGRPRAGKHYVLELDNDARLEGTTDGAGYVVEKIPAAARRALIRLEVPGLGIEEYELMLGHLDPVSEVNGVQQRLNNLGFCCAISNELDRDTKDALSQFQEAHGLGVTGELDAATRKKLRKVHGS